MMINVNLIGENGRSTCTCGQEDLTEMGIQINELCPRCQRFAELMRMARETYGGATQAAEPQKAPSANPQEDAPIPKGQP